MSGSYLLQVSGHAGYDVPCACGHRKAEHSAFDTCHGCNDCGDDEAGGEHEHPFRRCGCDGFADVVEVDWDALIGSA